MNDGGSAERERERKGELKWDEKRREEIERELWAGLELVGFELGVTHTPCNQLESACYQCVSVCVTQSNSGR